MIRHTQTLACGGISLELSACVSSEALQLAFGGSVDASELSRISIGSSAADQLAVLAPVQRTLVQAHEALRESLVQLALAYLDTQISDAVEGRSGA